LWGKPTIVNNVETFANIPVIVEKGADWYASIGNPSYPGTKVLPLLVISTIKHFLRFLQTPPLENSFINSAEAFLVVKNLKRCKSAVPQEHFIGEDKLDTPVAFDAMAAIGATLGSGAVFVIR
jgi:NADH:ubiquinone oxidoreductase subunit F (NADH-binding)